MTPGGTDSDETSDRLSELRDRIRRLHLQGGEPSLRDIAKRSLGAVSHTTVGKVLGCARLPRWGQLEMVVEALDGDVEAFRRLWLRARAGDASAPAEPCQALDGLPPATAAFVGRVEELQVLSSRRLVVISGLAGVGKSELALHYAHRAGFAGGRLFANFHDYDHKRRRTPEQVLETFLRALGVQDVPPHVDERSALFRSLVAGRPPMLIVLDNVDSAASVRPLLLSGHQVIVTSRHLLAGLDDAYRLELGVLSPAEATALVGDAELAELCGRLPLALRIMKALRGAHPDQDWTAELREARLDTLDDGDRSVSAAFDLSYRALTDEQRRFLRLAVLHPSTQLLVEGAALLAGIPDQRARRLLRELRAAHLVESGDRLHDLVQEYVAGHTGKDEERHAALVRFFDGLARRAAARRRDFATTRQAEALQWFDRNRAVLLQTVVAANLLRHARLVIPLAGALVDYRAVRGPESDFDLAAQLAVDTAVNAKDWHATMNARVDAAYHCLDAGRDERAAAWFHSAWAEVRSCADVPLIERTLSGFVTALERTGRADAAARAAEDLRALRESTPRRHSSKTDSRRPPHHHPHEQE